MTRLLHIAAGVLGASAVVLGAFGAHALRDVLGAGTAIWNTAVTYHLLHAVALMGAALVYERRPGALARCAGLCFLAGVVLFSGSLYVLALGGPRWLGPVTPIGGVLLTVGWLALGGAAARRAG